MTLPRIISYFSIIQLNTTSTFPLIFWRRLLGLARSTKSTMAAILNRKLQIHSIPKNCKEESKKWTDLWVSAHTSNNLSAACWPSSSADICFSPFIFDIISALILTFSFVLSATNVHPKPGDLPHDCPFATSANIKISGKNWFNIPRADSTMRLGVWGETRVEYATPRILLILPWSK